MERIQTTPIEAAWLERLRARGYTYDTVWSNGRYEDLKTKLLDVGGEAVILIVNLDDADRYRRLLTEGELFTFETGESVWVRMGDDNVSHNVNTVVENNKTVERFSGFSLSEDGCWRYYDWGWDTKNNRLIETIKPQLAYYGIKNFWATIN